MEWLYSTLALYFTKKLLKIKEKQWEYQSEEAPIRVKIADLSDPERRRVHELYQEIKEIKEQERNDDIEELVEELSEEETHEEVPPRTEDAKEQQRITAELLGQLEQYKQQGQDVDETDDN